MADIDFNNPQGPTNPNQASLLGPIGQGLGSLSDAITSEAKDSFDSVSNAKIKILLAQRKPQRI